MGYGESYGNDYGGAASVDFSDRESSRAWMRDQQIDFTCKIACRAALRTAPLLAAKEGVPFNQLVPLLRSILSASCFASAPAQGKPHRRKDNIPFKLARKAAKNIAAKVTRREESSATNNFSDAKVSIQSNILFTNYEWKAKSYAADSAAACSELTATANSRTCQLAMASLAAKAPNEATGVGVTARLLSELSEDAAATSDLFSHPVWRATDAPKLMVKPHLDFLDALNADAAMSFWVRFYEGLYSGRFSDWDLASEINRIPEEDWEKGYEHIGEMIAGIEARIVTEAGTSAIEPEDVLPENVTSLFAHAPIVQASMTTLATTTLLHIDAFSRLTRPNEEIAFFETMKAIPVTAQKIGALIAEGPQRQGSETELALEVGRLRAEVAQLKANLEAANEKIEQFRKKPWYRKSGVLLAGGTVSAIAMGLWTLSGDDKSLEDRYSKLAVDLEFLTSQIWPEGECEIENYRFELPEITNA